MIIHNVWGNVALLILYSLIIVGSFISARQTFKYLRQRFGDGGISISYVSDLLVKSSIFFVFCVSAWVRFTAATSTNYAIVADIQLWLWFVACVSLLAAIALKIYARWDGEWDAYLFFYEEDGKRQVYLKRINRKGE